MKTICLSSGAGTKHHASLERRQGQGEPPMKEEIGEEALRVFDRTNRPKGFKELKPPPGCKDSKHVPVRAVVRSKSINREDIVAALRDFRKTGIKERGQRVNINVRGNGLVKEEDEIGRSIDIGYARLIVNVREFQRFNNHF